MSNSAENTQETPQSQPRADFVNPIDKDKVAENPGLLPYAHTAGGAVIKPTEQGVIRAQSLEAMAQQTDIQMTQIYEQMRTLAEQAHKIKLRAEVSKLIYASDINFEPVINHIYCLYLRKNGGYMLSMITPQEWGRSMPFAQYCAKVRLMADRTWEVLEASDDFMQQVENIDTTTAND
ncbi:DUF2452 domain-containing protein [Eisenibacter elegans]|jgi:hypothetical protein|uniref:DUF2452 domain-containing protein n=1 Tax=Eisenibacter elegans TaxID=997 RepID=UPI0003F617D6|nr:DUF2452 domain-containing protein [Eisenibacter elegans]